jgi:hypothetical protein
MGVVVSASEGNNEVDEAASTGKPHATHRLATSYPQAVESECERYGLGRFLEGDACGTVAAGAALCVGQFIGQDQLGLNYGANDELSDSIQRLDFERDRAVVNEKDFELASIVAVHGSGAVENGDTVTKGETGARAHLAFETLGNREHETGGNEQSFAGVEAGFGRDGGAEV